MAYPSVYMETACISAIEAMSAKCMVVCPNLGALPETCSNFAWLYGYEPNPEKHIAVHSHILGKAIESYRKDETETLLSLQKTYFDTFYNWDMRMNQWNQFLESIKMRIEMGKDDTT